MKMKNAIKKATALADYKPSSGINKATKYKAKAGHSKAKAKDLGGKARSKNVGLTAKAKVSYLKPSQYCFPRKKGKKRKSLQFNKTSFPAWCLHYIV